MNYILKLIKKLYIYFQKDKNFIDHKVLVARRTFLIFIIQSVFFAVLLVRILYLQVFKFKHFVLLSNKNSISVLPIYPARGKIYSSDGKLICHNKLIVNAYIYKYQYLKNKTVIENLIKLLKIDKNVQKEIFRKLNNAYYRDRVELVQDLTWNNIILLEENIHILTPIQIDNGKLRFYCKNYIFSHVLGYVRFQDNEKHVMQQNISHVIIGKSGIEKQYNQILSGQFGTKKVEVNAKGLFVRTLESIPSVKGQDIVVNIDCNLQEYIYSLLPDTSHCTVSEVNTGRILAMCSKPSFNPNKFITKLSHKYWQNLHENKAMVNRTIQSTYPVGSIFKLVTILAALDFGIDPSTPFRCTGKPFLGKHFRCWKTYGHGIVKSMQDAIKFSCNHYIYQIAQIIGHEQIIQTALKYGFGIKTNIDLPFEKSGVLPIAQGITKPKTIDSVSFINYKYWSTSDTLNLCIGQGSVSATPIQILRFISAIASEKGAMHQPSILSHTVDTQTSMLMKSSVVESSIDINKEYLNIVRQGMYKCVNEYGGTAYRYKPREINISGKTSTAQVVSRKKYHNLPVEQVPVNYRNHGIFTAFAPSEKPKYAVVSIVEHGGGAASAIPTTMSALSYCVEKL